MIARTKAFGAFWYGFIVGDDWQVFAGIVAALAVCWAVSRATATSWWIVPAGVVVLLPFSLWKASRAARRK